jgi:glycosyltransferase involved in cell wall biosynthesis
MRKVPVSVVIPVRNGAAFVGEALQSVLEQTCVPQEVIVVDDGSTDATAAEVARFPEALLLSQPPCGAGAARNAGARRVSMPYLGFLDADDLWAPTKTELQLAFLAEHPELDIVSGRMVNFARGPDGAITPLSAPAAANLLPLMLIRSQAFWRVGPLSTQLPVGETIDWWARAMDLGVPAGAIPSVVLMRRVHGGNQTAEKPMHDYLRVLHGVVQRRRGELP